MQKDPGLRWALFCLRAMRKTALMQASGIAHSATPRNQSMAHGEARCEIVLPAWRELEQANWSKAKGAVASWIHSVLVCPWP